MIFFFDNFLKSIRKYEYLDELDESSLFFELLQSVKFVRKIIKFFPLSSHSGFEYEHEHDHVE